MTFISPSTTLKGVVNLHSQTSLDLIFAEGMFLDRGQDAGSRVVINFRLCLFLFLSKDVFGLYMFQDWHVMGMV